MRPRWIVPLALLVAVAFVGPVVVRLFVIEPFRIPAGSMLPALEIGDQFFVDKTETTPERGDVMVFTLPVEPRADFVKRVVALGGDEVAVTGGVVSINGAELGRRSLGRATFLDQDSRTGRWHEFEAEVLEETNGARTYRVLADPDEFVRAPDFGPVVVPEGHVFFLGDNRDHSFDSRAWGPAPVENLIGRASTIWFSAGPNGVRTERMLEPVR